MKKNTKNSLKLEWLKKVVSAAPTDDCIIWPFAVNYEGYGYVKFAGRSAMLSGRAILIMSSGDDLIGMHAAHGPCNNRRCCNPSHLSWKTPKQNQRDRFRDGTDSSNTTPYWMRNGYSI